MPGFRQLNLQVRRDCRAVSAALEASELKGIAAEWKGQVLAFMRGKTGAFQEQELLGPEMVPAELQGTLEAVSSVLPRGPRALHY